MRQRRLSGRRSALLFNEEEQEEDDDEEEATIRGFLVRVLEAAPLLSAPWLPCGGRRCRSSGEPDAAPRSIGERYDSLGFLRLSLLMAKQIPSSLLSTSPKRCSAPEVLCQSRGAKYDILKFVRLLY